jgi:uncharacterized membrane protein
MASKMTLFLIASLAVNAALLGVVGGQLVNKQQRRPPMETQANRPPPSDVMAAWGQLPEADRKELQKQFRDRWVALSDDRKRLTEAGKAVHDAAMAEPFDEGKLRDTLIIYQQRQQRMSQSAEDILISHLGKMPPEARATAAVGLLTPFNARMQRSGDGRGPSKGLRGDELRGDGKRDGSPRPGGPLPAPALAPGNGPANTETSPN